MKKGVVLFYSYKFYLKLKNLKEETNTDILDYSVGGTAYFRIIIGQIMQMFPISNRCF